MREAGLGKIQRHAQQREELPDDTKVLEAPSGAPMKLIGDQPDDHVQEDPLELNMADVPDSKNFYGGVNADLGNSLEVDWNAADLADNGEDHVMSPMMDVLQCLGVSAADSANSCAQVMGESPKRPTQYGLAYNPTFSDIY